MAARDRWMPAYIGIGSNLGDPVLQVTRALKALAELPGSRLIAASNLYQNPPVGPAGQPDYVNAVAGVLTHDGPLELFRRLRQIEHAQGRIRTEGSHWGPRTLDLDLLVYGEQRIDSTELLVPHPGIRERNFVLLPLAEIAPGLEIPGLGSVRELAAALDGASLKKIEPR